MLTLVLSLFNPVRGQVALPTTGFVVEQHRFGPLQIAPVDGEAGLVGKPGLTSGLDHAVVVVGRSSYAYRAREDGQRVVS
jgi:hypothetical protein